MSVKDQLKGLKPTPAPARKGPVWRGPEEDGITFSLLSRFLTCRERFRLLVVEGLKPSDQFSHRIEYGQMWHVCEEALATYPGHGEKGYRVWEDSLKGYVQDLCKRYPLSQEQIAHWYEVCKVQFPLYVDHWAKHPDVTSRTPLLQEQVFDVPYKLPSGRVVRLRGKWDAVDLVGEGKSSGVYLQENKTKADIDEAQIKRQLTFDLQTMLYLVALKEEYQNPLDGLLSTKRMGGRQASPIRGVRYNVVRRPLSGGKGTIVRHKPSKSNPAGESREAFYQRVAQYIRDEPESYFMRWKVEVLPADVARFRRECLDPILEQLCEWWGWVKGPGDPFVIPENPENPKGIHWRHPFGSVNTIDEYGSSDLDAYLESGSEAGLRRVDELFPELGEGAG